MIREVRGTVLSIEPTGVVVDVSGFGVLVCVPSPDAFPLGAAVTLKTHMAVKQDGVELYGFPDPRDLRFFELVLKVPGVGPKTAISLLRRAPRASIEEAIGRKDLAYLTKVAGLGKKSAEKLLVEIAEKVGVTEGAAGGEDGQVFDTLVALGYTEREARGALAGIPKDVVGQDARLKAALSQASR
jgi:Holliday junction DNA helicase RuvA